MHLSPEQVVDRLIQGLAHDVPAGDLDPRQDTARAHVRPLHEAGRVDQPPDGFDIKRTLPNHEARGHVLDHVADDARRKRDTVDFPIAADSAVRGQLYEDPVGAALVWRRSGDRPGFDIRDLHRPSLTAKAPEPGCRGTTWLAFRLP